MSVKSTLELVLYLLFNIPTILSAYCRGRIKSMSRPNDMNVNSVKLFFENVANLAKKKRHFMAASDAQLCVSRRL